MTSHTNVTPSAQALGLAVQYLEKGRVISFPTETVYALACAATSHEAISKIAKIKQRATSQVFAILVRDMEMMARYAYLDERIRELIFYYQSMDSKLERSSQVSSSRRKPGSSTLLQQGTAKNYNNLDPGFCRDDRAVRPLTCVLNYKPSSQHEICAALIKDGKIGMRIPNHPVAQAILNLYGKPIVATSVNLSGEPSACSVDEMPEELKAKIDLIIDGGSCELGTASTVVDFTYNEPRVLR